MAEKNPSPPGDDPLNTLLEEAIEAWEDARSGLLEEARDIPDEEWDFRPSPESRSVRELLVHVLRSGEMMVGELTSEEGDFTRRSYPELLEEHAGHLPDDPPRKELLDLLTLSFAEGAARIRAAGELRMLQLVRRFDGKRGSRLAWMQHAVAHEYYHRGQLALYARLLGRVPALTRRIEEGA